MSDGVVIGGVFVLLGLIIGVGLYSLAGRLQERIEAARHWREAPAVIETARLVNLGKGKFAPRFTYSYAVAGSSYTGKRLQFGGVGMTRDEAEAVMTAYPAGGPASVRYDPHRHDFAVLRVDADVRGYRTAAFLVGGLFVFCGVLVAVMA